MGSLGYIVPDHLVNLPSKEYKIDGIGEINITENVQYSSGMFNIMTEKIFKKSEFGDYFGEKTLSKIEVCKLLAYLKPEYDYITDMTFADLLDFVLPFHNIALKTILQKKWSFHSFENIPTRVSITRYSYFALNDNTYMLEWSDDELDPLRFHIRNSVNAIDDLNSTLIKLTQNDKNKKLILVDKNGRMR